MTPLKIFKTKSKVTEETEKKEGEPIEEKKAGGEKSEISFMKVKPVLIKPYLSEKASNLTSLNKYVFEVEKGVNKTEVKKFIEKFYNVKVEKVNFVVLKIKKKRMGRNITQFKPKKKAIVTLKEGYKIEI